MAGNACLKSTSTFRRSLNGNVQEATPGTRRRRSCWATTGARRAQTWIEALRTRRAANIWPVRHCVTDDFASWCDSSGGVRGDATSRMERTCLAQASIIGRRCSSRSVRVVGRFNLVRHGMRERARPGRGRSRFRWLNRESSTENRARSQRARGYRFSPSRDAVAPSASYQTASCRAPMETPGFRAASVP